MQQSIFDLMYEKYKITKPIRLIEFFAGYGSQALALKYLGVPFEHWKTCEWAVKSIQAYKDIHFTNDNNDYSKMYNKDYLIEQLHYWGISSNYNEPMDKQQIKRLSEDKIRTIYNNIISTHNLVNIQQAKGKDLDIKDTDKFTYLLTYSFPCQDLSLAGKGKGMSDTSTRSGMLWEVERILGECQELGNLPEILLMENVPQVHGEGNVEDFNKWQLRLEELGYKNYFEDLIATDYGIPQTRNRCFMVSILGDYNYTFPKPIKLEKKLKDLLEDNVDEKYYLSEAMIKYIYSDTNSGKYNRLAARQSCDRSIEKGIACTITTTAGQRPTDNFIKVKNATKQSYLEASDGDGIDLAQPNSETRRGRVQKEKIQTLTTQDQLGVIVLGNYMPSGHEASRIIDKNGLAPTFKENHGTINAIQNDSLRIRKLTPKECFRLMGVKDDDYEKVAINQSNASLYHLAGDSIVVNVLMAIFGEMI